jgi:hypothetical protein
MSAWGVAMKRVIAAVVLVVCSCQWTLADVLYTKSGETYSGKIESITRQEVTFRISRGGFEYEIRAFPVQDIMEILDDQGKRISFRIPQSLTPDTATSAPAIESEPREQVYYQFSLTRTYSRWPLLVGTVAFATIGIVKLSRASSQYADIRRDEKLGYEVTARKDAASRERLWGELSIAAGVVCLFLALTPEKVRKPMLSSVGVRSDLAGLTWSIPLD